MRQALLKRNSFWLVLALAFALISAIGASLRPYGELRQGLGGFGCRIVGSSPRSSRLMLSR